MLTQTAPLPHVTSGAVVLHHQCKDYPLPWTMDLSEVTRLRMDFSERVETNVVVCRRILGIFSHQSVRWCVESMRFDGYIYIYIHICQCVQFTMQKHTYSIWNHAIGLYNHDDCSRKQTRKLPKHLRISQWILCKHNWLKFQKAWKTCSINSNNNNNNNHNHNHNHSQKETQLAMFMWVSG